MWDDERTPRAGGKGASMSTARSDASDEEQPGLKRDIEPQWVIRYTAVVKNRDVIENKWCFAVAQVGNCTESGSTRKC